MGDIPWGYKELDTTEQLTLSPLHKYYIQDSIGQAFLKLATKLDLALPRF